MTVSGIDIAIKKSKRKTVSIFIERDGSVSARVPEDLTMDKLKEVLKRKEYQIHKHLAEWALLNSKKIEREYVNGQSFLYRGRNYRLKLVDERMNSLGLRNGRFLLSKDEQSKAKELFVKFYKRKLMQLVLPLVKTNAALLGVNPNEVRVMELRNRWASCTSAGNVNFHWKCAMAPADVLNYIVVHELVHLIHQNHTAAFWNEVDKILPKYEQHAHWLKNHGAGMDL